MSTLVWRYGLLAPTAREQDVGEQMRLAHKYANKLTEIERERRVAVEAVFCRGGLAAYEERVVALEARIGAAREEVARSRGGAKKRKPADPVATAAVLAIREELRDARAARKEARARIKPVIKAELDALKEPYSARVREARGECGVYWGTYLQIEQSAFQARSSKEPPRFRAWRGDGAVSVQIQKGMPVGDLYEDNTRVRLTIEREPVPGRGGKPLPRLMLRIGSVGREPVWAEWPVIVHRPLPDGARVKWAKVVRRRVAAHHHWSLLLTLEGVAAEEPRGTGAVALDLRWRKVAADDGATTVAGVWSDGAETGEIDCPASVPSALNKANSLRGIRDQHLDPVRAALVAWRDGTKSAEHRERMSNVGQWRAAGRFAALSLWWREHRVNGDADIFDYLESWRRRDKHLWEWEANARRKALLRRREAYRVEAARLARRYETVVVEKLNLAALAVAPEAEDAAKKEGRPARVQRVVTAPAELREAVIQAFRRRGGRVVEVPPCSSAAEMLRICEGSGEEKKAGPARSKRYNMLRGLAPDGEPGEAPGHGPLATAGANDGNG